MGQMRTGIRICFAILFVGIATVTIAATNQGSVPKRYLTDDGHLNVKIVRRDLLDEDKSIQKAAQNAVEQFGPTAISDLLDVQVIEYSETKKTISVINKLILSFGSKGKAEYQKEMKSASALRRLLILEAILPFDTSILQLDDNFKPSTKGYEFFLDPDLKSSLLDLCEDRIIEVSSRALIGCGQLGFKGVALAAKKIIEDPDLPLDFRMVALRAVLMTDSMEWYQLQSAASTLLGPESHFQSLEAFWGIQTTCASKLLTWMLEENNGTDPESILKQTKILGELLKFKIPDLPAKIKRYCTSEDSLLRNKAMQVFGKSGGKNSLASLIFWAKSDDSKLASSAVEGIGYTDCPEGVDALIAFSKSANGQKCLVDIFRSLVQLRNAKGLDFIHGFVKSSDSYVQQAAKQCWLDLNEAVLIDRKAAKSKG